MVVQPLAGDGAFNVQCRCLLGFIARHLNALPLPQLIGRWADEGATTTTYAHCLKSALVDEFVRVDPGVGYPPPVTISGIDSIHASGDLVDFE
jgi:hypothetical protein